MRRVLGVTLGLAVIAAACESSPAPGPTVSGLRLAFGGAGAFSFANRNQTAQLVAPADMSDGTTTDVTASVAWTTSNGAVASVSGAGLVTAIGNGSATITGTYEGRTGTFAVTVAMRATAIVEPTFARLCTPFRAQMSVVLRETSNNIGFRVTLLEITMTDINGVQRYHRALSVADIIGMVGTNLITAGGSQTITVESAYPGNVDTQDSTGRVIFTGTDDAGNPISETLNNIFQRDRC
jgi:hypothetical protein